MGNMNWSSYPELKILKARLGLTDKAFAERIGRKLSYVSSRLNAKGSLRFDLKDLFSIQELFNLSNDKVLWLLSEEQRNGGTD